MDKILEIKLLELWNNQGIKVVYRRKHRIYVLRENSLIDIELFYDVTNGRLFSEMKDLADYSIDDNKNRNDVKVEISHLLTTRLIDAQ